MPETKSATTPGRSPPPEPSLESSPQPPSPAGDSGPAAGQFPIVGIGASAGGLEALEGFFANLPANLGMAFVVIQHLAPKHRSIMADLLEKYTTMHITQITDGMQIEPDWIFLNPPEKDVTIANGTFQLAASTKTRGIHLPIDCFFRALAVDRKEKAICIVLSGTGSDGTLGLQAVKGAGGMTMVQEERQAKYPGMPRSAIGTGHADLILPVEKMAGELQKYVQHPYLKAAKAKEGGEDEVETSLHKIFVLLRSDSGHDFSNYKETTIRRRIERRMAVHQINSITEYVRYLRDNPGEADRLYKDLLIGVTNFFRDPEAFETLRTAVLPPLLKDKPADAPIRIWVPGCATGEEAYSLAILFLEVMESVGNFWDMQVFASDLDDEAIEYARNAVYPESIAADVSPERLCRFFVQTEQGSYRIKKHVREMVVFAEQNLIHDPPFSRLDLLSCRNLLIYLKPELQVKLISLFFHALNPHGVLFLGASESIGEYSDLFTQFDHEARIFHRAETLGHGKLLRYPPMPFFESHTRSIAKKAPGVFPEVDLRRLTERILVDNYAPPSIIVNGQNQLLYASGNVDQYLAIPPGEPSFDILAIARQGLKQKLKNAIREAAKQNRTAETSGLQVRQGNRFLHVRAVVRPLSHPAFPVDSKMVVFYDETPREGEVWKIAPPDDDADPQLAELESELHATKESLQTTIEELETSNEELRATNEELQSVNEELQSSNEELKTSKEELHSTNEELSTVNTELQMKIQELSCTNDDFNNLLASTEIGTMFLDVGLNIKRFTPSMTRIFNLIASDVNRPISDITTRLDYSELAADAKNVLNTLDRMVREVRDQEGRCYSARIFPYRSVDNIIDGVVVTFVDITAEKRAEEKHRESNRRLRGEIEKRKRIEEELREARVYAENIVNSMRDPLVILDSELQIKSANRAFYEMFQTSPRATEERYIYDLGGKQWDIAELRAHLQEVGRQGSDFERFMVKAKIPGIGGRKMMLNARRIMQEAGRSPLILLIFEDLGEREAVTNQSPLDGPRGEAAGGDSDGV